MICPNCKADNAPGAAFCGTCGTPIPQDNGDEGTTLLKNNAVDISDDVTMVMTNGNDAVGNMMQPSGNAPAGNMMQPSGNAPAGNMMQPPVNAPVGNMMQQSVNTPVGNMMQQSVNTPAGNVPMPPKAPMPNGSVGMDKPVVANTKAVKKSKGGKIYLVASIAVMAAMIGVIVFGYFHFNGKLKDADTKNDELASSADAAAISYQNQITSLTDANESLKDSETALNDAKTQYETEISSLQGEITALQASLTDAQNAASDYSNQLDESNKEYAKYDNLIEFADKYKAQGNDEFFCSDSILHLKKGDSATSVLVYYFPEGELSCKASAAGIVSYEWGSEDDVLDDNRIYPILIKPEKEGNTVLTISNSANNHKLVIYISVEK